MSAKQRRIIKVYSEGRVTEPDYLAYWMRRSRGSQVVWGKTGVEPATLVDLAIADLQANRRIKRRYKSPEFDEIWCIFDVDERPNIQETIDRARCHGIRVAVSNPCFELWLVLHREDQPVKVHHRTIQRRADKLGLVEDKSIPGPTMAYLASKYGAARDRARILDRRHEDRGCPDHSNPSTNVWCLIDRLRR